MHRDPNRRFVKSDPRSAKRQPLFEPQSVAVSRMPPRSQSLADLTSRELDALVLLAKGKNYTRIAQELNVSYKTVVNISWQLKKKLDVDNLFALVQKAMQLLPPTDVLERRSE
jgi:DNA-binding NarL/FixJ family response regulator